MISEKLPEGVVSRTISANGVIRYLDGKGFHHNPDGPAVIHPDRSTYWLVTGRDPSEKPDGWFGQRWWFRHGQCHRTDGPAYEGSNGTVGYWVNNRPFTEKEFYRCYPIARKNLATDDQP